VESKEHLRISGLIGLAADERWVLAGSRDGSTRLFRAEAGDRLYGQWQSQGGYPVQCVALSSAETLAASGTQDGRVQVASVPAGETVAELHGHTEAVESLAFSPDGLLLASGSKDGTVCLWQRDGESFTKLLALPHPGPVKQIQFHPDGKRLGVLVQDERAVRVWNLDKLREELDRIGLNW